MPKHLKIASLDTKYQGQTSSDFFSSKKILGSSSPHNYRWNAN